MGRLPGSAGALVFTAVGVRRGRLPVPFMAGSLSRLFRLGLVLVLRSVGEGLRLLSVGGRLSGAVFTVVSLVVRRRLVVGLVSPVGGLRRGVRRLAAGPRKAVKAGLRRVVRDGPRRVVSPVGGLRRVVSPVGGLRRVAPRKEVRPVGGLPRVVSLVGGLRRVVKAGRRKVVSPVPGLVRTFTAHRRPRRPAGVVAAGIRTPSDHRAAIARQRVVGVAAGTCAAMPTSRTTVPATKAPATVADSEVERPAFHWEAGRLLA